jgi:hypothetical protein
MAPTSREGVLQCCPEGRGHRIEERHDGSAHHLQSAQRKDRGESEDERVLDQRLTLLIVSFVKLSLQKQLLTSPNFESRAPPSKQAELAWKAAPAELIGQPLATRRRLRSRSR